MKNVRGSIGSAVSMAVTMGALLGGCGQNKSAIQATSSKPATVNSEGDKVFVDENGQEQLFKPATIAGLDGQTVSAPTARDAGEAKTSLEQIREKFEGKSHLLVLEKAFWIDKKIWISVGIERSSVTGMTGSVMGYIPAYLRQINQLLVVDRDNTGRFAGDALTPDTPLNAYPIVEETTEAVVVDIASPRSPYGLTNMGFYGGRSANTELQPRLEYVKDITISAEGVAFKSVINAVSPVKLFEPRPGSPETVTGLDPYSVSLTLRTDWLLPNPSKDYVALNANAQPVGFFYSDARLSNGGTASKKFVNRISTTRKQVWEMSANTPALYQQAVREGILAWNEALGSEVLEVRLAPAGKDVTDPNTNNVIWDDNRTVGFAFANWRDNPETGEIMQGQVYMSGDMWAAQGGMVYDLRKLEKLLRASLDASRTMETQHTKQPIPTPDQFKEADRELIEKVRALQKKIATSTKELQRQLKAPQFAKRGFISLSPDMHDEIAHSKGFCQREIHLDEIQGALAAIVSVDGNLHITGEAEPAQSAPQTGKQEKAVKTIERTLKHMPYPAEGITREAFQASVVRTVVMHEVGHALGLRHNFMGSLETSENGTVESSSIMDYNDLVVDAQFFKVGDSDKAMIGMGYHRQPPQKSFKICTDEHVAAGVPGCHRHDYSSDPVDFFMTSQETNLIMGLNFAQRGDMSRFVTLVNRSLQASVEMVEYLNYPLSQGVMIDPDFAKKQEKAFAAVVNARGMYGLAYPEEIKAVYDGLSRLILGISTKEGANESEVKSSIIEDLGKTVLDEKSLLDKDARLSGVVGLLKIQDASARHSLKTLHAALGAQAAKGDAERNLESRMMDEYVQNAVKEALDAYFTVGAQEKQ